MVADPWSFCAGVEEAKVSTESRSAGPIRNLRARSSTERFVADTKAVINVPSQSGVRAVDSGPHNLDCQVNMQLTSIIGGHPHTQKQHVHLFPPHFFSL